MFRHRTGFIPMSGVERRLATARLILWEFDGQSSIFEHADHRSPDVWVEGVNDAGDEQLYRCG